MAVRSASDLVYVLISRLPLIALAVGVLWLGMQGLTQLELFSFGTEFMVSNSSSTNALPSIGQSDADLLSDALASGDTARMAAALDQVTLSGDATAEAQAASAIG